MRAKRRTSVEALLPSPSWLFPGRTTKARPTKGRRRSGRKARVGTWHSLVHLGPAGSRPYSMYVPPSLPRTAKVPVVLLLHGCTQSAKDFAAATGFSRLADRDRFVVVYPEQTIGSDVQRCWRWFDPLHQVRGRGEPAILAGIVKDVLGAGRWRGDPERVYVAGLSAGGSMALNLAASYPDLIAAVGVHSGLPYRSAVNRRSALAVMAGVPSMPAGAPPALPPLGGPSAGIPPLIVMHGTADATVSASNAQRISGQWLAYRSRAVDQARDRRRVARERTTRRRTQGGRSYAVTRWYTTGGNKVLEQWLVDGLGHAWSGGAADASFSDPRGPRATPAMWNFLSTHRRAAS